VSQDWRAIRASHPGSCEEISPEWSEATLRVLVSEDDLDSSGSGPDFPSSSILVV
jgi:hypothetical protein